MNLFNKVVLAPLFIMSCFFSFSQKMNMNGTVVDVSAVQLVSVKNESKSLNDFKGENGVLIIFTCNTCPFVVGKDAGFPGWEKDYNSITALAKARGFGVVLVNSNEAERKTSDSPEKMQEHALSSHFTAPYIIDNGHKLADALQAKTTPHVYLFDNKNNLLYTGVIDNSYDPKAVVVESYLVEAINSWDKEITVKSTKPIGCSIKRVTK